MHKLYTVVKFFFISILLLWSLNPCLGQQKVVHLTLSNSCRHDDQALDVDTYVWGASTDATDIVRRICEAVAIAPSRIVIKAGNVPNALAYIADDGSRQIIYNENYLLKIKERPKSPFY